MLLIKKDNALIVIIKQEMWLENYGGITERKSIIRKVRGVYKQAGVEAPVLNHILFKIHYFT